LSVCGGFWLDFLSSLFKLYGIAIVFCIVHKEPRFSEEPSVCVFSDEKSLIHGAELFLRSRQLCSHSRTTSQN
jgi:hypothetical protein